MAKFTNTTHKVTIDSLVDGFKEKLDNPYYIHMDRHGVPSTYYNQNLNKSTLDPGFKSSYSHLGDNSPIKYNKVNNFFIYGIERISVDLENGEFGLESNGIEGEAIILPNTIVPIPNDYFTINHNSKNLLFKVISVSVNTVENGSNFYKIDYKLDALDNKDIEKQCEDEFEMIVKNVGTQYNTVIRKSDYNYIDRVEVILERLKIYYCDLFYSDRVQAFILNHNNKYFYDPYLTEFLSKNGIVNDGSKFLHVAHQTYIHNTFSLDYDKTFFRLIENRNLKFKPRIQSQADIVNEYLSILCTRAEDYYKIQYIGSDSNPNKFVIQNFDLDLIERIYKKELYSDNNYLNIIIKYFNNIEIEPEDIDTIQDIDFESNISLFYNIPILIYILEYNVKSILRTS